MSSSGGGGAGGGGGGSFVANVVRRTWDLSEYEEKAKEKTRLDEEAEAAADARQRNRHRAAQALVVRAPLKNREQAVQLDARLGKRASVSSNAPLSAQGGYYCNVCEVSPITCALHATRRPFALVDEAGSLACCACVSTVCGVQCSLKDSSTYLDHINGKKHQRALGMTLRAERSTLGEVKAKLEEHKRKQDEASAGSDLEQRLARFQDEMDANKRERKEERRAEEQRKRDAERRAEAAEANFTMGATTSDARKRKKQPGTADDAEAEGQADEEERAGKKSRNEAASSGSAAAAASAASATPAAVEAEEEEDPEAAMMRAMGFTTGFGSSKK